MTKNQFNPSDQVILKAKANGRRPPLVMTIKGRVEMKIPPENDLHRMANLRQIDPAKEIYCCEWIVGKKRVTQLYDASLLEYARAQPKPRLDPGWRRI